MYNLLKQHQLRLLLARDKLISKNTFESGLEDWKVTSGEWHKITIDSNVDQSSGLDGNLALDALGSYDGGVVEKRVTLKNYGEIVFEHYVQNEKNEGVNLLKFSIDGVVKLEVKGPSPWYRCEPIGLTPGEHVLTFEYITGGSVSGKKAVVDTVTIYEAKDVKCLITESTPPKPVKNIAENKTLRGYSIYQEMVVSNTLIEFTAAFNGLEYRDFIIHHDKIFYYVDEFGTCYRGLLNDEFEIQSKALKHLYFIDLSMSANSRVGTGFC